MVEFRVDDLVTVGIQDQTRRRMRAKKRQKQGSPVVDRSPTVPPWHHAKRVLGIFMNH